SSDAGVKGGALDGRTYQLGSEFIQVISGKIEVALPGAGDVLAMGQEINLTWEQLDENPVDYYSIWFSADDYATAEEIATGITSTSATVVVPSVETEQGVFGILAMRNGEVAWDEYSAGCFTIVSSTSGIDDTKPQVFALKGNLPNPFVGSTTINYDLPVDARVKIEIFDVRGRLVRTLVDGIVLAGRRSEVWDGKDDKGVEVGAGIYFCRIHAGDWSATKAMALVK
ncbi:MAG: FlgD immunoglobulin-like domain containing protein, partial [bacterium]